MLIQRSAEDVLMRIAPDLVRPLALVEQNAIESAMILCNGNVTKAAKRLGISRRTLDRKLEEYRKGDA